jgi:diguanylate cyclase (GGDEF)-like protein
MNIPRPAPKPAARGSFATEPSSVSSDGASRAAPRFASWHPRVRVILFAVLLLPMACVAILVTSSSLSAWSYRSSAMVVAQRAAQLEVVASARAQMNALEVPLTAVTYAAQVGVGEHELDLLLHPSVPFETQLAAGTSRIKGFATFTSTPTMRVDVKELQAMITRVSSGTVDFETVHAFTTKMASDIDGIWYSGYNRLQKEVAAWQPPGSFEVHASALLQTYQAFLAGGHEIEGAIYVLEGIGPSDSKQELVQSEGDFQTATQEFVGHLGAHATRQWDAIQTNAVDRRFAATIRQGVQVALDGSAPPFFGNIAFAGSSMAPGLHYLGDLDQLVVAASVDLHDTALSQASDSTHRLVEEIVLLLLLAMACAGGVVVGGRLLTRPLKRLEAAAQRVHEGNFGLPPLADSRPREVATTTAAFNDMVCTLKAVEARAVALASEDLSDPALQEPLPGRTGRALQSSIDTLSARIKEREMQNKLLHEAATHDALTGLLNRPAVLDYLTNDVSRRREAGETVAVLFVDLDGLKPLNDSYGHEVGDAAILITSMALMAATDTCDVVGRLGGDEFLVVLCHDHSCDGEAVVERVRSSVHRCRIPVGDQTVPLEASVGVALAQCDAHTDPMMLVREADEAMYEAKKQARALRERLVTGG